MIKASKRLISILICLTLVLAMLPMAVFAADTVTVYYYNATNWEKVCVHYWGTTAGGTTWPGNAMTDLGGGYWSAEVPADITGIVFNNNNKGSQTPDLSLPTDGRNCYTGSEWITYTGEALDVQIDYYLRGSMNGWAATDATKMTDNGDGTYSITMDLAAGTYEYKGAIADWSWSCPGENAKLTLEADDTVTFTLNPSANTITYTLASGAVKIDYYLRGTMNDWAADDSTKMTDNGDGTYSITMSLAAGTYEYKAGVSDWSWSCPSGANAMLKLDCDSEVTFTLNVAANEIIAEGDGIGAVDPMVIDYIVAVGAGFGNFLNGEEWNEKSTTNVMTASENVYTITYTGVATGEYEFKFAANGTWDHSWGTGCTVVSGTEHDAVHNGNNGFVEVTAGGSDVTLTLDLTNMDPVTGEGAKCTVTIVAPENPDGGEGSEEPDPMEIEYIVVAGSGREGFTNDIMWDPASVENKMTENEGVYTITYDAISAGSYEFKFAANGSWDLNWGTDATIESGAQFDLVFNGNNCVLEIAAELADVTITLDLTNMDLVTGAGAKCTVTVTETTPDTEIGTAGNPAELIIGENDFQTTREGYVLNWYPTEDGVLTLDIDRTVSFNWVFGCFIYDESGVKESDIFSTEDEVRRYSASYTVTAGDKVEIVVSTALDYDPSSFFMMASFEAATADVDDGSKDIKFQTKDNSLRLVTWVDSLDYKEIVFNVTIGGYTAAIPCTTVYSSINAGGLKLDSAAAVFNEDALYFVTYTINNIPTSVTELQVSVTWTDLEGNSHTSATRTITL